MSACAASVSFGNKMVEYKNQGNAGNGLLASTMESWYEGMRTPMEYPEDKCLHELFVAQAQQTPDHVAVVDRDREFTYSHLKNLGVERNRVVGIFMERCAEYVIAYLGILKAGGGYMPMELAYPPSLLSRVIDDSQPVVVLTKQDLLPDLPKTSTFCMDSDWSHFTNQDPVDSWKAPSPDTLAYVVYSSGTTGLPKGICCPHRGAVHSYHWRHVNYPFQEGDRVASNVFLVWEVVRPLFKGYPVYIIPDDVIYDPPKLISFLVDNEITRILLTPSLAQYCLDVHGLMEKADLSKLRILVLCGEVVTTELRNRLVEVINNPNLEIPNLYSIAECHDVSCVDIVSYNFGSQLYSSCGRIFPNVDVHILDDHLNIVPVDIAGEVFVGGPTLAIGYLNQPEMTNAKFISWVHPRTRQTFRLYRTGDRGILREDGHLEIWGRCDSVVKLRGYTVVLDAIEAVMENYPLVQSAVALAVGNEGAEKSLVGYIVPVHGENIDPEHFRAYLNEQIPSYSVPSVFIKLEELPINANSAKCDRKKLPHPSQVDPINILGIRTFVPLETETEREVAAIWMNVLGIDEIGASDDFLALGGHSLSASKSINLMKESEKWANHAGLTVKLLLEAPQLRKFASLLDRISMGEDLDSVQIDFHAESQLNLNEPQLGKFRSIENGVLLTGVTGFVGAFLLEKMVSVFRDSEIFVLIRGPSMEHARARLESTLESYAISVDTSRINILVGDLAMSYLGLEMNRFFNLSSLISTVYHCGAHVNLVYPYKPLKSANVLGTKEIIRLCALSSPPATLNYVSTLGVFPTVPKSSCIEGPVDASVGHELHSGYSQSKLVGELLVQRWNTNFRVFRLGNISWNTSSSRWNHSDAQSLILASCILMNTYPDPQEFKWKLDLTPVDLCVSGITDISQRPETLNSIFHVINSHFYEYSDVFRVMISTAKDPLVVDWETWKRKVESSRNTLPLSEMLWNIVQHENADFLQKDSEMVYETSLFREYIGTSLESTEFIKTYISQFVAMVNKEFQ